MSLTLLISAISAGRIGDPVLYHENLTIGRAARKPVPFLNSFQVARRPHCQMNAYDRQPCEFSRFVVELQQGGHQVAPTSPLPDGMFSVHSFAGNHIFLVRDYGRQIQATVKTTSLTSFTFDAGKCPVFDWTVDGAVRLMEGKRFGSKR